MLMAFPEKRNPVPSAKPIELSKADESYLLSPPSREGPTPIRTTQATTMREPKRPHMVNFCLYKMKKPISEKMTLELNIEAIIPLFIPLLPAKKNVKETIT